MIRVKLAPMHVLATLVLIVASGCDSTPVAPTTTSDHTLLSNEQAAEVAIVGAKHLAHAVAAIVPVKDLQAIYENGRPRPQCPIMTAAFAPPTANITLDYREGCQPETFGASWFKGQVRGSTQINYNSISYEFEGFSAASVILQGRITGGFKQETLATRFSIVFDLTSAEWNSIRGSGTVLYDEAGGRLTISEARLSISKDRKYQVTLGDAEIDSVAASTFVPHSGSATVSISTNSEAGATHTLEFTKSTALDRTMFSR